MITLLFVDDGTARVWGHIFAILWGPFSRKNTDLRGAVALGDQSLVPMGMDADFGWRITFRTKI